MPTKKSKRKTKGIKKKTSVSTKRAASKKKTSKKVIKSVPSLQNKEMLISKEMKQKKISPGISLEKVVCQIQQMMDKNSTVTHNELLEDRVGNKRQYDVVIRGKFGGRPVLGVIECKDHSRKIGPNAIEAFSKKTENLGANLRVMVSKKGFTKQALKLAKHENIGCLSLLPSNPEQIGFSIGDMWYGVVRMWANIRLIIHFSEDKPHIATIDPNTVKWNGKLVVNWFIKELLTTYGEETKEGDHFLKFNFSKPRNIEVESKEYSVIGIACRATRIHQIKRKWVYWSGDAFVDWHNGKMTIPPKGQVVGSAVETDITLWPDYDGEIPELGNKSEKGFIRAVLYNTQKWDKSKDKDVPDLSNL